MSVARPPVGAVLAGGRSSRMGTDKALVEVDGIPMARLVADALLAGGCERVWCQGGDTERLALLGLDTHADPEPHTGPLAAIAAAIASATPHDVVVCACDLPALDGDTVAALIRAGRSAGALVAVACDEHGAHLAGWWSTAAAAALAQLLGDGVHSYREAVRRLGAVEVPVAPASLRNVNRPADLA
jgi:molybdopterin-guanine dinucleotide biosynthesis protein A